MNIEEWEARVAELERDFEARCAAWDKKCLAAWLQAAFDHRGPLSEPAFGSKDAEIRRMLVDGLARLTREHCAEVRAAAEGMLDDPDSLLEVEANLEVRLAALCGGLA
jgi:hypothetical protein